MKRALVVAVTVPAAVILGVLIAAPPASAHPLGNFSVNRYAALTLGPSLAEALVVADIAELPTLQDPAPTCAEAAEAFIVAVDGTPLSWSIASSSAVRAPGAGGLATTRLECRLTAPVSLRSPSEVEVTNAFRDDRIGWRELVAAGGPWVRLSGSPLPAAGISDELRRYPDDLLSSPPDVRSASFMAAPGPGGVAAGGA
ncbi:hypothetical protein AB0M20_44685, partial [Actinoplanes sp. NPDC051633]|uniref:hypothetical protein n=1 Tax=Actinoplanes sp. NPDC051633 TaxID=3155670 RepID=UPI00341F8AA8